MKFRTEIETIHSTINISHSRPVLMLGSCFTDNIGARLEHDGFKVLVNPFGALYNPISIVNLLQNVIERKQYDESDLTLGPRGYHCLDFASSFSGPDKDALLSKINNTISILYNFLEQKPVIIITFGTAFCFSYKTEKRIIGNCHKFPAYCFDRFMISSEQIISNWLPIINKLSEKNFGCDFIFTVSPIRHTADGLHGNNLSKSVLLLSIDELLRKCHSKNEQKAEYFPAFEIVLDDLRDYRFYASDMKHPSEVAVDYIYEVFSDTYFNDDVKKEALIHRKENLRLNHRQILPQ